MHELGQLGARVVGGGAKGGDLGARRFEGLPERDDLGGERGDLLRQHVGVALVLAAEPDHPGGTKSAEKREHQRRQHAHVTLSRPVGVTTIIDSGATLTLAGATLSARILSPVGAQFVVEPVNLEAPQKSSKGISKLSVKLAAPATDLRIAVLLAPGPNTGDAPVRPLAEWQAEA